MEGIIKNYRRGVRTINMQQAVIEISGVADKKKANSLAGKEVSWKSVAGKEIRGKILSAHGSRGAVRARFERGLPGQAVGQKVMVK